MKRLNIIRTILLSLSFTYSITSIGESLNKNENIVYVSSSGNDNNTGFSIKTPLRTIAAAVKKGKDLKLKCGDVFYESVILDKQSLSSYGKGKKPVISGWKRIYNSQWKKQDEKIWQIDLENKDFRGRTDTNKSINNIGLIRNIDTGQLYGVKRQFVYKKNCPTEKFGVQRDTWLRSDMEFAQTSNSGYDKPVKSDYRYLYLYSETNPNGLNLEFSTYGNGITAKNSSINGIRIEGFSCHGIAAGTETTIIDCEICFIGGAQQMGNRKWVRYGNGIEYGVDKFLENGYAGYNIISHSFDCGTTIQGSNFTGAYPRNIVFEHNRIYNCRQAFEYFLNNDDKKTGEKYDCVDCAFRNNICIDNGNNGFGTHESRDGQILSYQNDYVSSIKIENNIFVGGTSLYFAIHPENIHFGKGNVFFLTEGTTLWSPYQANGRIKYSSNNIKDVRKKLIGKGVDIGKFKLVKVSAKKLEKLKKKYLETNL